MFRFEWHNKSGCTGIWIQSPRVFVGAAPFPVMTPRYYVLNFNEGGRWFVFHLRRDMIFRWFVYFYLFGWRFTRHRKRWRA